MLASFNLKSCSIFKILTAQSFFSFCFAISLFSDGIVLSTYIRAFSGFIILLLIPGILLSCFLVDPKQRNIAVSILIGLVVQVFLIQLLYWISLFSHIQIPLFIWSVSCSWILCLLSSFYIKKSIPHISLNSILYPSFNKKLILIFSIAVIARMMLWILSDGSIAPDAALYSDFSRSIINGQFNTLVINDSSVVWVFNDFAILPHQAFTYFFAISWLLIIPNVSGPSFILVIIGVLLIFPTFEIAKHFFGEFAAICVSTIIAIHPLFVFHSAVSYGPEIASLLLLMFAALFLLNGVNASKKSLIVSGVLIGLVDAVWYANFYIICFIGIILPLANYVISQRDDFLFLVFLFLPLIARVFYFIFPLYMTLWIFLFGLIIVADKFRRNFHLGKVFHFYLAILLTNLFWRFPSQINTLISTINQSTSSSLSIAIMNMLALMQTGIQFLIFFLFHLTPGFIVILFFGLIRGNNRYVAINLTFIGLIASLGTIVALSRINESLQIQYLYSDSRFFLFISMTLIIASGSFFSSKYFMSTITIETNNQGITWIGKHWKTILVLGVLSGSMIPGYFSIPSGLALIDIDERYGWTGLPMVVKSISGSNNRFLADRAREFSWYTETQAIVLSLTSTTLGNINASTEVLSLIHNFNGTHLLIDHFTIARWSAFEYLLRDSIIIGHSTIIDHSAAIAYAMSNITNPIYSCTLVGETQPNNDGAFSRIFQLTNRTYNRFKNVSLIDAGWDASNVGSISNYTDGISLTIGSDAGYTNTWRPGGYDLNLHINNGYLLFNIENAGAIVTRIEVFDSNGIFLSYAENVDNRMFYCPVGEVNIGDIRIVIEGDSGNSVIIKSIAAWEAIS